MFKFLKRLNSVDREDIEFLPMGVKVPVGKEETVLDLALSHNVPLDHSCGGMGTCGTCKVYLSGEIHPDRSSLERVMAEDRNFASNERLACQIKPNVGMIIKVE